MKKLSLTLAILSLVSFQAMAQNADRFNVNPTVTTTSEEKVSLNDPITHSSASYVSHVANPNAEQVLLEVSWFEKAQLPNQPVNPKDYTLRQMNKVVLVGLNGSKMQGKSVTTNDYLVDVKRVDEKDVAQVGQVETGLNYSFTPTLSTTDEKQAKLDYHLDLSTLDGIQGYLADDKNSLYKQKALSHGKHTDGDLVVQLDKPVSIDIDNDYQVQITLHKAN
jgi:hypothetical protein